MFNYVYSRDNLPILKNGTYVINLVDQKKLMKLIEFRHSLTEIRLCALILLELDIFAQKY